MELHLLHRAGFTDKMRIKKNTHSINRAALINDKSVSDPGSDIPVSV